MCSLHIYIMYKTHKSEIINFFLLSCTMNKHCIIQANVKGLVCLIPSGLHYYKTDAKQQQCRLNYKEESLTMNSNHMYRHDFIIRNIVLVAMWYNGVRTGTVTSS